MNTHHGFHRRFLNKRQSLSGVLGGLIPGSGGSSSGTGSEEPSSSGSSSGGLDPGGIASVFSSLFGDSPTAVLSSSEPSSVVASSTSLTNPSSSSTGSTTTSAASSIHTSTSTSPTGSTSANALSTSATAASSTAPTSTPSASDIVFTSSDGASIVYITSTPPAASASSTAAPPPSFLHDPSLEGGVFAVVGILALIVVFVVVTWTIRKRQRDRLERDTAVAVTFDPGVAGRYEEAEDVMEKRSLSGSSSGHGHGYGYGHGTQLAYASPQEYHAPEGYGQYPMLAYHTPSPNTAPYQVSPPAVPQPTAQGGANLTRKFSDRKPVPPLLLTPAYDPANTHVSIPPQYYQR